MAGPLAVAQLFQTLENEDADDRGAPGGAYPRVSFRATQQEQDKTEAIPEPADPHARGGQQPEADPARRFPVVHPPHNAVVAVLDESPDGFRHGHGITSTRPI